MADKGRVFNHIKEWFIDILFFIVGGTIYACSITFFTSPNDIAPGGVTGIAIMLNHVFGLPMGTMTFAMNIPLFILYFVVFGGKSLSKTVIATLISSAVLNFTPYIPFTYTANPLLASLYGGLLSGVGLALVFLRGGTTGGTDIGARLVNRAFPFITVGRGILFIDAVIIIVSAFVFNSIESALYAVIVMYVSTKVIDAAIYGGDRGKLMYVISQKSSEISKVIMEEIDRGVTLLDSKGAYTGKDYETIMCALRINEVARVRKRVRDIDPDSFIIIGEVSEIVGRGFKLED